jgi:hypothetical protein
MKRLGRPFEHQISGFGPRVSDFQPWRPGFVPVKSRLVLTES